MATAVNRMDSDSARVLVFVNQDITVLQDRVYVPTGIWKAVYEPVPNIAGAYLADNRPGWAYRRVSIAELTRLTGVDPFPALPASVKTAAPDLPPPHHGRY